MNIKKQENIEYTQYNIIQQIAFCDVKQKVVNIYLYNWDNAFITFIVPDIIQGSFPSVGWRQPIINKTTETL